MTAPTKSELLAVVCQLMATIEQMSAEYGNDVAPNRAEAMKALRSHGVGIAQECINRVPYSSIERAMQKYPNQLPDTGKLRGGR